jgi:hypothetical protein
MSDRKAKPFGKNFGDRMEAAAKAREAALEKFRARPSPDDPAIAAKKAEREAIVRAREARQAEKEAAKAAETAARAEQEALDRAAKAEREEREAVERIEREAALEIEKKAARDARYAARKARKR